VTAARLQVCIGVLSITSVPDCGFELPFLVKKISPIESACKNEETVDRRFFDFTVAGVVVAPGGKIVMRKVVCKHSQIPEKVYGRSKSCAQTLPQFPQTMDLHYQVLIMLVSILS